MKPVLAALLAAGTLMFVVPTPNRQAPTDLEVGTGQFISYQDLLRFPQISFTTSGDSNFPAPVRVSGVSLDKLLRSFDPKADMVVAICADGYRSNYPAA